MKIDLEIVSILTTDGVLVESPAHMARRVAAFRR
jgi:hypothetical protein